MESTEFWDSLASSWRSRVKDPLLGPLLAALAGSQWQFFYILWTGSGTAEQTIDKALSRSNVWGLSIAACVATLFVFGYPKLKVEIVEFAAKWHMKAINARKKVEDDDGLMTWAEAKTRPEFTALESANNAWHAVFEHTVRKIKLQGEPQISIDQKFDRTRRLIVPGFAARGPGDELRAITVGRPLQSNERLVYCFVRVGETVLLASHGGVLPWPDSEEGDRVCLLPSGKMEQGTHEKEMAWIQRLADQPGFGTLTARAGASN